MVRLGAEFCLKFLDAVLKLLVELDFGLELALRARQLFAQTGRSLCIGSIFLGDLGEIFLHLGHLRVQLFCVLLEAIYDKLLLLELPLLVIHGFDPRRDGLLLHHHLLFQLRNCLVLLVELLF